MARIAKITDNDIYQLIVEYRSEYPNVKIKYSDVERFGRNKGLDIKDNTLKKRPKIVDYIKELNSQQQVLSIDTIFAYTPLDINSLLTSGKSKSELREALNQREVVYQNVVNSAVVINEENKRLKDLNKTLKLENKKAKDDYNTLLEEYLKLSENLKEAMIYKDTVKQHVYPEMANIILDAKYASEIVNKDSFRALTPNEELFDSDEINEMMKGFKDE